MRLSALAVMAQDTGDATTGFVFVTVVVLVSIGLYFLPAWVAFHRGHGNRVAIFVLNLLAGWTFVGWVVALVWSCTAVQPERVTR